jgi:cell division protein FtsB
MIAKNEKNRKVGGRKWFFLVVLIIFVSSIFLAVSNWKIIQKRNELKVRIDALKAEINILEEKNAELKEDITQGRGDEYAEKIARESLSMKKPGEEVLVVKMASNTEREVEPVEEKSFWEKILDPIRNLFGKED